MPERLPPAGDELARAMPPGREARVGEPVLEVGAIHVEIRSGPEDDRLRVSHEPFERPYHLEPEPAEDREPFSLHHGQVVRGGPGADGRELLQEEHPAHAAAEEIVERW